MKPSYYNENDPYPAQWLRNLIDAGHIPAGDVDERDIREVQPDDLAGYGQIHLFAGIAGWSRALRLAGIPDDRSVWTASCPCPPFSSADKRQKCPECESRMLVWCPRRTGYAICAGCGHAWLADERHLWPEVWRLAAERRPQRIYGEQVTSIDGVDWLAGVRGSLEILGYAVGAPDLPAAGVGASHIRQRLWWMAQSARKQVGDAGQPRQSAEDIGMANANSGQWGSNGSEPDTQANGGQHGRRNCQDVDGLDDTDLTRQDERTSGGQQPLCDEHNGGTVGVGNTASEGLQGQWREYCPRGERCSGLTGLAVQDGVPQWNGPTVAVKCADGARRVSAQPNAFPLAHGVSARVGKLRAYGNAIVPALAAEFIKASMEC